MIVLWITLLLFQQADLLSPMKTVQVGEPVTFMCVNPYMKVKTIQWFKQSPRGTLKLIVALKFIEEFHKTNIMYEPGFSASQFDANMNEGMSNLRILRSTLNDEGMYHCAASNWTATMWSSTYLSVKGSYEGTSNLSVVQWPSVSDPVRPGDLMTLQCSVLSDSDSKTCPGGHSVYWFRAGSDNSYPDFIYTDESRSNECDQRSNAQKSCLYNFSKKVDSSDVGTYYCAVAACGRILYGNGTKVEINGKCLQEANVIFFLLSAVLALSLIVIAVLICANKKKDHASLIAQNNCSVWPSLLIGNLKREEVYSAAMFTMMKRGDVKGAKAAEEERIYAAVKAFGLD